MPLSRSGYARLLHCSVDGPTQLFPKIGGKLTLKILMISGARPLPADNGAKRRILASAIYLSRNHDLTLLSLKEHTSCADPSNEGYDVSWRDVTLPLPSRARLFTALRALTSPRPYMQLKSWNSRFHAVLRKLMSEERFDAIWVHQLCMAPYIDEILFRRGKERSNGQPLTLLDQQNVDGMYFRTFLNQNVRIPLRIYAALEVAKATKAQRRLFPAFDAILCVSPEDLRDTARYTDKTELWLAPNGVDLDYFRPDRPIKTNGNAPVLVFGASMDVKMNQDAVAWFSSEVFPLIQRVHPEVHFSIVGRNPPLDIVRLSKLKNITVTGTVPDVRTYYREAAVFVVPCRLGGGTKLKTLEAMAMGLPVVTTSVGAQGLEVESGRHLHIVDGPEDFADRVVELLKDRGKASEMGAAARKLVEQKYGWDAIMAESERRLTRLLHTRESERSEANLKCLA